MAGRARAGHRAGLLRNALLPALAILVVTFFAGFALFGRNGLVAWREYQQQLERKQAELAQLERRKVVLQNRVRLVDPKQADPDMVDELVRNQLGVADPDEVIVPLK